MSRCFAARNCINLNVELWRRITDIILSLLRSFKVYDNLRKGWGIYHLLMFRTISYDVIALYTPSLFFYLSCVVVNLPVANHIIGIKSSVENRGIVATNFCFLSFSRPPRNNTSCGDVSICLTLSCHGDCMYNFSKKKEMSMSMS